MEFSIFSFLFLIFLPCCFSRGYPSIISKDLSSDDDLQYRLPKTSRPFHYDLHMKIDVDEAKFYGSEVIHINVLQGTDEIAINYKDMDVDEFSIGLLDADFLSVPLIQHTYNNVTEILRLRFPQLIPGEYSLSLDFNGTIRDDLKGLYISTYFDQDGNKRNIATTFMAPNYARMAFPCYDEPEYKATYSISISHKENYFAISNMPAIAVDPDIVSGWKITTFDKSLKTSTYIVTFIVCDFVANKDPASSFTIYSQPAVIEDTNFALEYTQQVLKELELYLDRKFQYPKMDIIAIDDFLMGAMENWGIITYLSSRVLVNDKTDEKAKHQVTKTIAHELAHQWFGNEVTHFYWSAVWLKEGLASLFEDSISGIIFPDWHTDDKFVLDTMLFVMQDDAGKTGVRKMFLEVETVDEIRNIYDFVTYKKAASVMRTMANILTGPTFKEGLRKYINDFSFDVAAPDDLSGSWQWAIDQSTPGRSLPPIKEVFDTWITNPGFPFITVTRNYDTSSVTITQQRFMATLDYTVIPNTKYYIPLNYASPSRNSDFKDTSTMGFLKHTDDSAEFPVQARNDDWVIFNARSTMYYRVNYDMKNWELITDALIANHSNIDPANRAQLIDDAFNLARYGYLSYDIPLNMMKNYFPKETYYYTVASGVRNLDLLNRNIRSLQTNRYSGLVLDILRPLYTQIGITEDPSDHHLLKMLRTDVTLLYCKFPQSECVSHAYNYLVNNLQRDISANVRRSIYCGALQYNCREHGDENCQSDYPAFKMLTDKLSRLTRTEATRRINDLEIKDIIAAFGCVKDTKTINDILRMTTIGYPGIEFDKSYYNLILQAVLDVEESITKDVLVYLRDNFKSIESRSAALTGVFQTIGKVGVTDEHKSLLNQIIETHIDMNSISDNLKKSIDTATDTIDENLAWNNKLSAEVLSWLEKNTTGSASNSKVNFLLFITVLSICYLFM
ncbi:aminopeptidase N-like [Lutzomyia longipalpis]|uniref:aminopeptidase N-like n=1 Tax=Lutzomyia longipalpis TaxID=7200 RepID=UPI002483ECB5|nr:aminopeptidase N-like [Lutzomyia longipalpis]